MEPYRLKLSGPEEDKNMKTLRNSSLITLAVVTLALLVATPVAFADTTETFTSTLANASDNLSNELYLSPVINQFNSSLGTLQWVDITFVGTGVTTLTATNSSLTTNATNASINSDTTVTLNSSVGGINTILTANNFFDDVIAGVSHQTILANTTDNFGPLTMTSSGGQAVLLVSGLGLFENATPGSLGFELNSSTFVSSGAANGSFTAGQKNNGSGGTVTVEYDYTTQEGPPPLPDPGTLSLFGTGLLGLAGLLRSRFSKSS